MGFLDKFRAKRVRRTRKEMLLDDIDNDIADARMELDDVNRAIIKAHEKRATLYRKTLDDITELEEQGFQEHIPVKKYSGEGDYTEIIAGFLDDEKLGIPKVAKGAIRAFLKNRKEMINALIDGVVNAKMEEAVTKGQIVKRKEIEQ